MTDESNSSGSRSISPAGSAVNRALEETWRRNATRFAVTPADGGAGDAALQIDGRAVIDSLGVDFPTLRQRLIDLAMPKRGLFGGTRAANGTFRLRLGGHDVCVTVDPHPMAQRVDCALYVPRDFRPSD